ncbi:hypothetical protein IGI04_000721, partial [Brassica rapa subsp. trilocularis]
QYYLGNGGKASFWYDHWSEMGPLIKHFGPSGPFQTGIRLDSTVAGACSEDGWLLRPARSSAAEAFQIMLCSMTLPSLSTIPDSLRVNHCPSTLRKLTVQAVIYRLWRERNQRLHNGPSTPPQVCFKEIDRLIRNAILARKNRRNFRHLMGTWLMHE